VENSSSHQAPNETDSSGNTSITLRRVHKNLREHCSFPASLRIATDRLIPQWAAMPDESDRSYLHNSPRRYYRNLVFDGVISERYRRSELPADRMPPAETNKLLHGGTS
jgi:hypothetical protein